MPRTKYQKPTEVDIPTVTASTRGDEALKILRKFGVVIIPLNTITTEERDAALKETKLYSNANRVFKVSEMVEEPTMEMKKDPSKFTPPKVPDANQGMIHQYATPLNILIQNDDTFREAMVKLYQTEDGKVWKGCYAPNRLRMKNKNRYNDNSLHIEGKEIFLKDETTGEISLSPHGEKATIVGVSGVRKFVFWDMNGANLKPLYDYWVNHGCKHWTKPEPSFMNEHYKGRRRVVTVDCSKHPMLIVWDEHTPHEIADSPALSAFISPITAFNTTKITKVMSYHPDEYLGLTKHESDLLGMCYGLPGYEWPSGKMAYQFCHTRTYSHYLPRVQDRYKKSFPSGKQTFKMKLPLGGKFDQHSDEYKAKLNSLGIVLPKIAFANSTPNFTTDITKFPKRILIDYGYIPTMKTEEENVAEALLELSQNNKNKKFISTGHHH